MRHGFSFHPLLAGLGTAVLALSASSSAYRSAKAPVAPHLKSPLPVFFQPVPDQHGTPGGFVSRAPGRSLTVTAGEVIFSAAPATRVQSSVATKPTTVRVRLAGSDPHARCTATTKLPGEVHYLTGRDQGKWRTHVPTYAQVRQVGVYPGIDAVYYGANGELECDYVVEPGADPDRISIALDGENEAPMAATLMPSGDVNVGPEPAVLTLRRPVAYQNAEEGRRLIDVRFALREAADRTSRLGFEVGEYDRAKPLVIDPVLTYSTYLGGSGYETGYQAIPDGNGNIYVTGDAPAGFPTLGSIQPLNGTYDLMVAKLNASGALVYATYIGGSGYEGGNSVAVDSLGNAYVSGLTFSADFPLVNAFQTQLKGTVDGFLLKLNAAGTALVYSSYLGGSGGENQSTNDVHLAVDSSGSAYATGSTTSVDFPVTSGAFQTALAGVRDAFAAKVSPTGALVYATYLGGSGSERGTGIAVDVAGAAYVGGKTNSLNLPTTAGALQVVAGGFDDGFVLKLNPSGTALEYGTYLGGSQGDVVDGLAIDLAGSAYVIGSTNSADFPTQNALQPAINNSQGGYDDGFVLRLNPSGSALVFSTYFGGTLHDFGLGIAVDRLGNVYVAGETESSDFVTALPFQPAQGGDDDAFVMKLNPLGSTRLYSSFLGGTNEEFAWNVEVDGNGTAYICGLTNSANFPTVNPAQAAHGGSYDYFVSRVTEPLPQSGRAVAPKKVNFGSVRVGATRTKKLKLRNTGTTPLSGIVGLASGGVTVTSGGGAYLLPPKGSLTIHLRYAPAARGTLQGVIPISTTDPGQPMIYLPLTGKGK